MDHTHFVMVREGVTFNVGDLEQSRESEMRPLSLSLGLFYELAR